MDNWSETDRKMLEEYTRPIVHLRRQFEAGRLNLVFGTGLTQQVGIPGWNELNDMIALDPDVDGEKLLGRPTQKRVDHFLDNESRETIVKLLTGVGPEETITTQRLFEYFKKKKYEQEDLNDFHTPKLDSGIYRDWRQIIRNNLYLEKRAVSPDKILENHKYIKEFLPILKNTPVTITYNFDDVIEAALYYDPHKQDDDRGYEAVTDLRTLPRRKSAVIYHPNGYIPRNPMEEKTQEMVLSESEFANRMIELASGQYNSLFHIFSRNTCLLIGLSLKDSILKNLLKQSAMMAPGNYHYYIDYYEKEDDKPTNKEKHSIEATNFDTYNLRTLFLSNEEIKSIGKLIYHGYNPETKSLDDNQINHFAIENNVDVRYNFYIIGAIGVGKSTCVSHLRSLVTHDEWHEDRLPSLGQNWQTLEDKEKERKEIDEWIANEFKQKNHDLIDTKPGISVCDRCPLDPISFTPESRWREKAEYLLNVICPGKDPEKLQPGHVIYLWDDPEHLDIRVRRSPKKYDKESLDELQKNLDKIYDVNMMFGVTKIDCRFQSFYEIMKRVSRIIHMEKYEPANIHGRLIYIKDGGLNPND